MLLIDNREPESAQQLLAKNEQLWARIRQLTKVLDDILRVRDCQGVWGLAGSQEIKDARRVLGVRWEVLDAVEDIIQDIIKDDPWQLQKPNGSIQVPF